MDNKEKVLSSEVKEKINALGEGMIMRENENFKNIDEALSNLKDDIEEYHEENPEVAKAAVTGGIDPRFLIRKTRQMVKNMKVGRNDPCPCGSGKRYKHCCLDSGKYEGYHTI